MDTAQTSTPDLCSVPSCCQPCAGAAARSSSVLCRKHLDQDNNKVQQLCDSVKHKYNTLTITHDFDQQQLTNVIHSIATEIQTVNHTCDDLIDQVNTLRQQINTQLDATQQTAQRIQHLLNDLKQCNDNLVQAEQAANMKTLFEQATDFELLIDDTEEQFELYGGAHKVKNDFCAGTERVVGDVSGCVKDLQYVIQNHMRSVMQLCGDIHNSHCESQHSQQTSHAAAAAEAAAAVNEKSANVVNVDGIVKYVTSCLDTRGFVADQSGQVVTHSSTLTDTVQLPQPCLYLAFYIDDKKDHLLVTSIDGSHKLRCHCNIDWNYEIKGLHCDSTRQLLYVAQLKQVTVTDLSGCVTRVISHSSHGHTFGKISGIDGNDHKVFVFDCVQKKVFGLSKDTGDLETEISVDAFHSGSLGTLSVRDNKILLTDSDNGKLHKVCMISKQLVTSYPTHKSNFDRFKWIVAVAVDSRGLMHISDGESHTVTVMLSDGTVVQTLGSGGDGGSDLNRMTIPLGLTVVEGETGSYLIVCEWGNSRLQVWELM